MDKGSGEGGASGEDPGDVTIIFNQQCMNNIPDKVPCKTWEGKAWVCCTRLFRSEDTEKRTR